MINKAAAEVKFLITAASVDRPVNMHAKMSVATDYDHLTAALRLGDLQKHGKY